MADVLVYFTTNVRAVDQQSVIEMLVSQGHSVVLLTLSPRGELHSNAEKAGVIAYSGVAGTPGIMSWFKQAALLIRICRKHRTRFIFAHLQEAGIPAIIARPFLKTKLFYTRHNTDEGYTHYRRKLKVINLFIESFADKVIAPSDRVYHFLLQEDKLDPRKVLRINYGYNFRQYQAGDGGTEEVRRIREQFSCNMLLVSVARLVPEKQHVRMFAVVKQLIRDGLDIRLICIGQGPLLEELQQLVKDEGLGERITMLGFRKNVFDFLHAADAFIHLSETEASNSAVKEAAIVKLPAIVCQGAGDFEEYIDDGYNGYLVPGGDPVPATVKAITKLYHDPVLRSRMGARIFRRVISRFTINNLKETYHNLLTT
jgi:glycosyltransferase involved in cell wall biosynthesis